MSLHSELLGKTNDELIKLAPEATHQHKKGGLYRYIGLAINADNPDEGSREIYEHVYPYKRQFWHRDPKEFNELNRFMPLNNTNKSNLVKVINTIKAWLKLDLGDDEFIEPFAGIPLTDENIEGNFTPNELLSALSYNSHYRIVELEEALKPFSQALINWSWEHPISTGVTLGDFRKANKTLNN